MIQGQNINPNAFYDMVRRKVMNSKLSGFVPKDGAKFGITKGTPEEWARFFTALTKQESGMRIGQRAPDGSIIPFKTTPRGERSYGPGQFNVGEYGLKTWDDVNNPERVADAYINVADRWVLDPRQSGNIRGGNNDGMSAYFGSIRRPHEVQQHLKWAAGLGGAGPAPGSFRAAQEYAGPTPMEVGRYMGGAGPAQGSFRAAQEAGGNAATAQALNPVNQQDPVIRALLDEWTYGVST